MLKINTKKGKFDISFAEEKPFQHETKPHQKFGNKPPKGSTSRTSVNHNKQNKPPEKTPAAVRQLNGKPGRSDLKLASKSHTKAPQRMTTLSQKERDKRTATELEIQQSKPPGDAGYITQTELQNILSAVDHSRLDNQEIGASLTKVLLSVLKKDQGGLSHKQTVNSYDESHQVPAKEQLDQANVSHLPQARHSLGQPNDGPHDKTAQWKSELDAQVAERNRRKAEDLSKGYDKLEEYNPWGRPGAGAPMRTHVQSGNVVADYRRMAHHGLGSSFESLNVAGTVPDQRLLQYPGVPQSRPEVVTTVGSSTSYSSTSVPAAMQSSFAIGAPGLVSQDAAQRKADEHKKYLQELNKQIQEKKERERQEKLLLQQEDQRNATWTQHLDQYKTPPKPQVVAAPPAVVTQPQANPVSLGPNMVAQPQATPVSLGLNTSNSSTMFGVGNVTGSTSLTPRTHARGHGMYTLDLQSQEEADKKRQKMLEHQRAIQEQVEEKRRIKQQEKEQRMKEEALEEARLARERERIQQQHEMDQRKQREKEEEAKRRSEALRLNVLQAYEEAQQAKNDKRLKHLAAAGHDVSGLKSRSNGATSRSYVIDARGTHLESERTSKEPGQTRRTTTPREERDWTSRTGNFDLPSEYNALIGKETEMKHSSSYDDHSSFKIENSRPVVPPLELERGNSPPVPAVRSKIRAKSPKRSSREKCGKMSRTGSSLSEPVFSQRKKSPTPRSQRNKLKSKVGYAAITTPRESRVNERPEVEDKPPFAPLEDAFMVPYLRTTSATLPPPPDTAATTEASANSKSRGRVDMHKNTQNERTRRPHRGENLPSLNRSRRISLKEEVVQERSPQNAKRTQETQKSYVKSKQASKENSRGSKGHSLNTRQSQEQHKRMHKDHASVGESSMMREVSSGEGEGKSKATNSIRSKSVD